MARHQCTRVCRPDGVLCPVCGRVFLSVTEEFRPDPAAQRAAAGLFADWVSGTPTRGEVVPVGKVA